jgi:coenzyme F420-0:L-glutamate ligase/coenzyme F420-1:gamma-L-glutamate ligase
MKGEVQIIGLHGFPLINPGDDIASLILKTARSLRVRVANGDIIVIGHKIVSKSEGRIMRLSEVKPSRRAFRLARRSGKDPRLVQLILNESKRVIKVSPDIVLVETKRGIVCLNAGIDKSNVEGRDAYCLLPRDPDQSAERIAGRIRTLTGKQVRTIITDTYSRPFRVGQSEFAIGVSGLDPFVDYRGTRDLFGHVLKFKRVSIADEIASAAELVMGQGAEGVPAAIIRGVHRARGARSSPRSRLTIHKRNDLFQGSI